MEKLGSCPWCGGEAGFMEPEKVKGAPFVTVGIRCKKCQAYLYLTQVDSGLDFEDIQALVEPAYRAIVARRAAGGWM